MAKIIDNSLGEVNLISSTTSVTGNIVTESDIRIDGTLLGNLDTKGRLIIGANGKIEGDITCKSAEIEGTVKGKIDSEDLLSLKSTSSFIGDIITAQLYIEPNALFQGHCEMRRNK
jgi:cytoskeletal protein CcmA (bactofilin family)